MTTPEQDDLSLGNLLSESLGSFGDEPLLGTRSHGTWEWITYSEFGQMVDNARAGLAALGVSKGDRVAVISNNRVEWAVGAYGAYTLGAVWVPMYEAQHQAEWRYILGDCEPKVVFVANERIRDIIESFKDDLPALEHVVTLDGEGVGEAYSDLLARGADKPVPALIADNDDLATIVYTSGTTGNPKGVMLSHGNLVSNVRAEYAIFAFSPADRTASFLPWAHCMGMNTELNMMIYSGASLGLTNAVTLARDMKEIEPTTLVAVPAMFNRVYDGLKKMMESEGGVKKSMFEAAVANAKKREELKSRGKRSRWVDMQGDLFDRLVFSKVREAFGGRLVQAFSGGAAMSVEVAEFISAVGITVYEGYGLTETSPLITGNNEEGRKVGSVGRAIPGVRVKIDTSKTGDSEIGEIIAYGPNVMQGYYNLPDEDAAVFTDDGGFRTGDLGRIDDDGFVFITGRIKEQYKLENGKYVVPSPIEEQLQLSGFVSQVMVHGEQRPFNVAVVVPDMEYLEKWASEHGLDTSDLQVLLADAEVRDLFKQELSKAQSDIKPYERVKDFVLDSEAFTPENGMLTPSLKIKRKAIIDRFGDHLDELYDSDDPLTDRS